MDDRAFAYIPEKSFGVISFSGMRMVDEIGLTKVFSDDFVDRIPFIGSQHGTRKHVAFNPGTQHFIFSFGQEYGDSRAGDILLVSRCRLPTKTS